MTDLAQRGPLGLKPEKPAKKPRTRINPVSKKRREYRASTEGQEVLRYMNDVKHLPCCICNAPPPSDAHHCFHGRFSAKKAGDLDVIPLCKSCHQTGPDSIHNAKAAWAAKHGPDHSYIKQTRNRVQEMRESVDW